MDCQATHLEPHPRWFSEGVPKLNRMSGPRPEGKLGRSGPCVGLALARAAWDDRWPEKDGRAVCAWRPSVTNGAWGGFREASSSHLSRVSHIVARFCITSHMHVRACVWGINAVKRDKARQRDRQRLIPPPVDGRSDRPEPLSLRTRGLARRRSKAPSLCG